MKRKIGFTLAAAGLAGFAIVGPGHAASGDKAGDRPGGNPDGTTRSKDCGDGDTIAYAGPLTLWPPNHKLQDVSMTATDGPSSNPADGTSDRTTLTVTADLTDVLGGDGGPRHDPDIVFPNGPSATGDPSATVPFQLRSERSGGGTGRVYDIDATATFDGNPMKSCSMSLQVVVPHDMGGGTGGQ